MAIVYLSLGSNLGHRRTNIWHAIRKIKEQIGYIMRQSALYETIPWGFCSAHLFINAAVCVKTDLTPHQLLEQTQCIEKEMGRTHKSIGGSYHDRVIDIDILLYDDEVINEPNLKIPHPLMYEREFVMQPLKEILL